MEASSHVVSRRCQPVDSWRHRVMAVALALILGLGLAGVACKAQPTATPITASPTSGPEATPTPRPGGTPIPAAEATPTLPSPAATEAAFPLTVQEPAPESVVSTAQVPVKGTTSPDAVVSVNGQAVPVGATGAFSTTVSLQQGPNLIEVVASDFAGHQKSAILAVIYVPQ